MRSQAPPLLPILRSRHQGELLAVLLLHPDREYTLSELSRPVDTPGHSPSWSPWRSVRTWWWRRSSVQWMVWTLPRFSGRGLPDTTACQALPPTTSTCWSSVNQTERSSTRRLIELSAVSTFLSIPRCAAAAVGARQLIPWSGRSSPLRWCGYWIGRTSKGQHDALGPGRSDHRTADRRPTAPEGVRGAGGWRGSAGTGSPNCRDCPDDRHG